MLVRRSLPPPPHLIHFTSFPWQIAEAQYYDLRGRPQTPTSPPRVQFTDQEARAFNLVFGCLTISVPSPVFSWLHFTPQWCSLAGRSGERLATGKTADECKELCKGNCLGVEWWEGTKSCFECTDPSKKVVYTKTNDNGYPPHVFLKSQNS